MLSKKFTSVAGAEPSDPQFNYVTMLMHGDGTNGNQNKTFVDSSSNNYTITPSGITHQTAYSPYGDLWSNYFDGSGDYLVTPSNAALGFGTGDFTVECWYYHLSRASTDGLIGNGTNLNVYINTSGTLGYFNGSSGQDSSQTVPLNTWGHIAVVRASGTLKMYYNGVQVLSQSNTTNYGTSSWYIGTNSAANNDPCNGYISNARIVKGTAVYTTGFTPPTAPLTAISGTSLLTCQSNRFVDNSSNAFAITKYGDTSVKSFSPFAPTTAYDPDLLGGSTYFNGDYNYISYPTSIAMPTTGNFTVEGWFFPTAADRMAVILWGDSYSAGNAALYIYFAGTTGITVYTNSTGQSLAVTGVVTFGEWVHVAVTRSSNTGTLWVNGVSKGTFTFSTLNNTGTFQRLGTSYYGPYGEQAMYVGYMSDVRYSNVARYSSTFTPNTAPFTNDASTVMLLNMANGDLYDQTRAHQYYAVGTAQVSTSTSKYGTGSISLPAGTILGSYLRVQDVPHVTTQGEFTYECWFYSLDNSKYHTIWSSPANGYGAPVALFSVNPTMGFSVVFATGGYTSYGGYGTGVYPTVNTWTHLAVTRDASNTWRFFINGVLTSHTRTAMIYFTGSDVGPSVNMAVPILGGNIGGMEGGQNVPAENMNGTSKCYIDDLRITSGVARYTSNFTVPSAAFPDK